MSGRHQPIYKAGVILMFQAWHGEASRRFSVSMLRWCKFLVSTFV